jgi:hypothetical protein
MVLSLNINYHLQLLKIVYLRSNFLFILLKLKMSKLFAITVNHINLTKTFVFDALEKYCSHLVVAEEKHFFQAFSCISCIYKIINLSLKQESTFATSIQPFFFFMAPPVELKIKKINKK